MTTVSNNALKELPAISWKAGNNGRYEVRSVKNEPSLHQFQLLDKNLGNPTLIVSSSASLKIYEFGHCYQQWIRKDNNNDLNVKMFATEQRRDVYFVATDLKHREIQAYSSASLNEPQWEQRLYHEEPNLEQNVWEKIFEKGHLPISITWEKTDTGSSEKWKKSYERTEIGLVRKHSIISQEICEDRVVYSTHAQFTKNGAPVNEWAISQVIETTRDGRKMLTGRILDTKTGKYTQAKLLQAIQIDANRQIFQINEKNCQRPTYGLYNVNSENIVQLGFYEVDEHDMHLQFMPGKDLAEVTHTEIETYVRDNCLSYQIDVPNDDEDRLNSDTEEDEKQFELHEKKPEVSRSVEVSTTYKKEQIKITREVYSFRNAPQFPAIHIKITQSSLKTALKCAKAFLPALSDKMQKEERELYESRIDKDLIEDRLLRPNANKVEDRLTGIVEFNKAHARSAEVDLFLSINRTKAALLVDQRVYKGYEFRKWCAQKIAPCPSNNYEEI